MNLIADKQQTSFEEVCASIQEFGANCVAGQRGGLGRPLEPPEDIELERVRQLLRAHQEVVQAAIEELRVMQIEEWIPAKIVKTRQEWAGFWDAQSQSVDFALKGLAPPDPLVDKPEIGEAKLNIFLSGFSMVGTMARGWKRMKA